MPKVILIVFHRLPLVNYIYKAYFCNNKFFNYKRNMMKRIFLILMFLIAATAIISSCSPSRKSGCPMNEGIIH